MSLIPERNEATDKQDPKRRALGRGLEVLLPPRPAPVAAAPPPVSDGQPLEIPVGDIARNPFQTRTSFDEEKLKELAQSITASGVVQPIVVRSLGEGKFVLITGERRLMASKIAGKATIPAIVRAVSDEQAMEMTIIENLQRADLNPLEQARAYARLSTEFHMTQEQMATRTGKDRTSVTNFLRLLKLPDLVQQMVESGDLSFGHARALLALPTPSTISQAARRVAHMSLSVRQTEICVQELLNPQPREASEPRVIKPLDANVVEAQQRLQRALGLRVKIEDNKGKGRVIIEYSDLEDFDLLFGILKGSPD